MAQEEKKRPKATAELAKEYDALRKKMKECRKAGNKVPDELYKRMYEMWDQYDWLNIVFHKDGKEGYITDEGEFVTKEQYEKDEKYDKVHFLNCMAKGCRRVKR